jgi:hypothetical protein
MSRIATTVSSEYNWTAGTSPATMRQKRQLDDMENSQVITDGRSVAASILLLLSRMRQAFVPG